MYPLDADRWTDFAVGIAGAAAALTGLLFVAVSINLQQILSLPRIPARAALSLILMVTPVFLAIAVLIPGQPGWALGTELLVIAVIIGPMFALLAGPGQRSPAQPLLGWLITNIVPSAVLSLGTLVAGISLITDLPVLGGLYWIPLGAAFALLGGLINAWVLLVEILR